MATTGKKAAISTPDAAYAPSIQDISDSYLYLLGRLLLLRQEHLDFKNDGAVWNTVVHTDTENGAHGTPNLDLASSEAWIAVDEHTCTLIEMPTVVGRYYNIQIVNLWGETIANINERTYPRHPAGAFLVCSHGARVTLPTGSVTERVNISGRKARVLIGIQHGADPAGALELRERIKVRPTGRPTIAAPVDIPMFTNEALPGVDAFDTAIAVLTSEPDSNPGCEVLQDKVGILAALVTSNTAARRRIDSIIRQHVWPSLKKHMANLSVTENGWMRPKTAGHYGDNWLTRTVANLTHPWANSHDEVVNFESGVAHPLNGRHTYTMTFPKSDLPDAHVKYFWSITCAHAVTHRVNPNPANRFHLNSHSPLQMSDDGSLTLYFAPQKPPEAPEGNWLPTPPAQSYVLAWRSYGPDHATVSGQWFPPQLERGFHHRSRRRESDESDADRA